jgi:hypothetical protein
MALVDFNITGNTLNMEAVKSGQTLTFTKTNGIYLVSGKIDNNLVLPQGQAWAWSTGYDWSNIGASDVLEIATALAFGGVNELDVLETITALMLESIDIGNDNMLAEYLMQNGLYSKYKEIMKKFERMAGWIFKSNGTISTMRYYDGRWVTVESNTSGDGLLEMFSGAKWFANGDAVTLKSRGSYYDQYYICKYRISGNTLTLGYLFTATKMDGVNPASMSPLSKSTTSNRGQESALLGAR